MNIIDILQNIIFRILDCFRQSKKVDPFILDDCEDVKIVDVYPKIDNIENAYKYLKHHILYTDDTFDKIYFDNPIFIKFKYMNECYTICVQKFESTYTTHLNIIKEPKLLSAVVYDKNDNEINITDKAREIHGHTRNFYEHIPDVITDRSIIFNFKGKLNTYDMMGNYKTYKL